MTRILLAHWHEDEVAERAERLEALGHEVCAIHSGDGANRAIRVFAPELVVLDLARLPSHGRGLITFLQERKSTRSLPLVIVRGDPEKTARLEKDCPHAVFTTWRGIRGALKKAQSKPPPEQPVGPKRPDYSGTPLPKKLGIQAGSVVVLLGAPKGFEKALEPLPEDVTLRRRLGGTVPVIVLFSTKAKDLAPKFERAANHLDSPGGLWVAWPKKTSGVATDLDGNEVRRIGLAAGLVDNKVCAIDTTWSGHRFAHRRSK